MIVIIDTMAIMYRSYYAIQGLETRDGFPTGALFGLINSIFKLDEDFKPTTIIACLDSKEKTLRQELCESYKANRNTPENDLIQQFEIMEELLSGMGIKTIKKPGHEADDLIGSITSHFDEEFVIATCDRDLLQLTENENVKVNILKRGTKDFVLYNKKDVIKEYGFSPINIIDYKGLLGDPSDNIAGVVGIGEKTAKNLITKYKTIEAIYDVIKKDKLLKDGFTKRHQNLLIEGKESAKLSKKLATIFTDIEIKNLDITKNWKDNISSQKAEKIFTKLEMASLLTKLKKIKGEESKEIVVDEDLKQKILIMLWIFSSEDLVESAEDILNYTKTNNLEDAYKEILKELKREQLLHIWTDIEEPLIKILKTIKDRGILIEREKMLEISKTFNKKIDKIEKEIHKLAGQDFNVNSPKQVAEILFDKLQLKIAGKSPKGKSTKEEILEKLINEHKIVSLILKYRHYKKLTTTYVDALPKLLDTNNRIHTTLIQNGTSTGRFSSKNPNLQNIPNTGEDGQAIRGCFIAQKGYKLLSADYSQVELRIASILSNDKNLIDIFKSGKDIHTRVASYVFEKPEDKILKDERNTAKAINFGILYGMGVQSLKKSLGVSTEKANLFLEKYKHSFKDLTKHLEEIKKEARIKGEVKTAFGRKRKIKGINSQLPFIRAQAERFAINAPIQGTSADVIKIAMINLDKRIKKEKLEDDVFIILQIHDELLFEVKERSIEIAKKIIKEEMENVYPENKKPIELSVSIKELSSWGE